MASRKVVGNPTHRIEGIEKVTGQAIYTVDVTLPGMLWGKTLRSPIPYGRIRRIDTSRAREVAGVRAVVTGEDVAGMRIGRMIYDMPILAESVVRFAGEKVAAVAAESEEAAEEALHMIEVEYEELEPLLDSRESLKPSAPLLHPEVMTYKGLPGKLEAPSNAFVQLCWKKGDVEEGFRQSDIIVENTFATQPVHQGYIEPHSCVVRADESGGAEIWACSKVPFALREQVATALGVPLEKLVLYPSYIGGDFGGKADFMDVPLCYVLARKAGRPVKMVMDYGEELVAGNPRHASIVEVKSGITRSGLLLARSMEFIFDSGAYGAFKPRGHLFGAHEAAGPYRIPNVFIDEKIVYTNKIPCGHMRAPGDPQGFFASESHMDLLARELSMDPAEFRKKNLMRDGDESPLGSVIPHIKAEETLERALKQSGYRRPKAKNVGRGIAVAQWLPLGGECTVFIRVNEDSTVTVSTAMMDQGAGTNTIVRQIVAEELKIPLDWIRVETLDTTRVATDTGVGASRSTRIYGNAAYEAAIQARGELTKATARYLDVSEEQIVLSGNGTLGAKGQKTTYSQVVKARGSPVSAQGYYKNEEIGPQASVCAQVAEVEVDPVTGQVRLRRFTTSHSTGTVINPLTHQGQIDGGVVMGAGYALMEQIVIDGGIVSTANFGDYKIPTIQDIPILRTAVLETPVGRGPYGSMSIGETPIIPVAPAIANAVEDAVGVRIQSLPVTAEKVLNALKLLT